MSRIKYIILTIFITLYGCSDNPVQYIEHIEGYWEIHHVEKNNTLLKEYNSNATVDYFKVNKDGTGFRKKVAPTLTGNYTVSQHTSHFILKVESDSLNILYTSNNTNLKETVIIASETELIITNAEGFTYTYRPFEKINLQP